LMPGALDPPKLRRAMEAYAQELRRHRLELNSLNVYPVPDGDTGNNMLLTQEAVVEALGQIDDEGAGFDVVGSAISRASLMGARGNSGVILSQVLRAICERMPTDGRPAGASEISAALRHAATEAHRAVAKPMDGTVLSVLREAADAAEGSAGRGEEAATVLEAALGAGRAELARTMEVLPQLVAAGVVDAGGKGILVLLDVLMATLQDQAPSEPIGPLGPIGQQQGVRAPQASLPGFEVQFLLEATEEGALSLRRALGEIGDSLVVVGGGGLFNVHVHTDEPDLVVGIGGRAGRTRELRVLSLAEGVDCIGGQARAVQVAEQASAMVAVVEGEGLVRVFASLGAVVVTGIDSSVPDLASAIDSAPAGAVVVLPNHPSFAAAAEIATAESSKDTVVVGSRSMPAGIAAAAAFNPNSSLRVNAATMEAALMLCRSGELVRTREADGGDWLGVVEGEAVFPAATVTEAAAQVVQRLQPKEGAELVTIVVGKDALPDDRVRVQDVLRRRFPGIRLEIVDGGQPRSPFLIGVE
jgi:DAK2 domain fusion protein YloV